MIKPFPLLIGYFKFNKMDSEAEKNEKHNSSSDVKKNEEKQPKDEALKDDGLVFSNTEFAFLIVND